MMASSALPAPGPGGTDDGRGAGAGAVVFISVHGVPVAGREPAEVVSGMGVAVPRPVCMRKEYERPPTRTCVFLTVSSLTS